MEKEIILKDKRIKYRYRKSFRARYMRLAIYPDASLVVTAPRFVPFYKIENFIFEKAEWILKKLHSAESRKGSVFLGRQNRREYLKLKETARKLALDRLEYYNQHYRFSYHKISIRNQKTRWGSCSKNGNLNFNYKIALLPEKYADYIIVHELCHLGEFNHSTKFWNLVAKTIPEYKTIRREIRKM
jgi:predicted metal-dependent hydrolase